MKRVVVLGLLALAAPRAAGQAPTSPDSAAVARYTVLLVSLRDAVGAVSARTNEFRRDLQAVGETTVLSRAAHLETSCREARTALVGARPQLTAARLQSQQMGARDSLLTAIDVLSASLQRDCERGLGPAGPGIRSDSLRAWGPHRTATLSQSVHGYHSAAARFARRIGADLTRS